MASQREQAETLRGMLNDVGKKKVPDVPDWLLPAGSLALHFVGAYAVTRIFAWSIGRSLRRVGYPVDPERVRAGMHIVNLLAWFAGHGWEGGRSYRVEKNEQVKDIMGDLLPKDKVTSTMKRTVTTEPE